MKLILKIQMQPFIIFAMFIACLFLVVHLGNNLFICFLNVQGLKYLFCRMFICSLYVIFGKENDK